MSEKKYPYTAWTLTPGFKPVETVFVKEYQSWDKQKFDVSEKDVTHSLRNIFASKEAAVVAGYERLEEQQKAIDKKQENLNKRKAMLDKHSLI